MSRVFGIVLPALLLCGGCDRNSQLEQVRQSIDSWGATLDLCAEQWARHRVPRAYLRQIVKAAGKSLDENEKRLAKISAYSDERRHVRQRLTDVRRRLHELSLVIKTGDPALTRIIRREAGTEAGGGGV